jgi:hypothetical protein
LTINENSLKLKLTNKEEKMRITIVFCALVIVHTFNPALMPMCADKLEPEYAIMIFITTLWAGIGDLVDLFNKLGKK